MTGDDAMASSGLRRDDATRIRAEMERCLQAQEQARQTSTTTARSDLDVAHGQSLPAGVEFYRMNTDGTDEMPPLGTPSEIAEEEEEEEDFEDDAEVEEEMAKTTQARKHKGTIDYSTKITKWQDRSVQEEDIRC